MSYEAGRCDVNGVAKKFDIADYWDVIRTLRPSREMIIASWSHSLEYSIGTSAHGVNAMNAICERMGFAIDKIFRRLPTQKAEQLASPANMGEVDLAKWMREANDGIAGGAGHGANSASLEQLEQRMANTRKTRCEFRQLAAGSDCMQQQPLDAIKSIAPEGNSDHKYSDALFPTLVTASAYYKPKALLMWATGKKCTRDEATAGRETPLRFKEISGHSDDAKEYDFAWLQLKGRDYKDGSASVWRAVGDVLKDQSTCKLFDMHRAGIADTLFLLASTENKRLCPEMPTLPYSAHPSKAFIDEKNNKPKADSTHVGLRPVDLADGTKKEAHDGDVVPCRVPGQMSHKGVVPIHGELDRIVNRCRLPALTPHMSTNVQLGPPIRRVDGSSIEVSSVCMFEHMVMMMEAVLRCSRCPGLKGLQERFASRGKAPTGLASDAADWPADKLSQHNVAASVVRRLPWSVDLMQIAWTLDIASRFYNPEIAAAVEGFNQRVIAEDLGNPISADDLPELTTRYPGYQRGGEAAALSLNLLSVRVPSDKPAGQKEVDISTANVIQDIDPELLRQECEIAIGKKAEPRDIEQHRMSLIGAGYVWGCKGDVFSYETWVNHLGLSMMGRGNTSGEIDGDGGLVDRAFEAILDSEFMFDARLAERRCFKGMEGYAKAKIDPPKGSTYRYQELHPRMHVAGTAKRKAAEVAPAIRGSSFIGAVRKSRSAGTQPRRQEEEEEAGGSSDALRLTRRADSRDE